jgi:lipopolysaccharide biosynthesis glycosyltransferase
MAEPILVTGCDGKYFLMTAVLMHSLKRCAPRLPLHVLDFGVDERQARFLERHCKFIRRPVDVPADSHPIFSKTQLASFLRDTPWSSLVWIDCDMMAVGALEGALDELITRMEGTGAHTALCVDDSKTIARTIAGGLPMQPFLDILAARGIPRERPYFNAGFFVCRSPAMIQALDALGRTTLLHSLFDQNLLNVLIADQGAPIELPARIWNLHGALLSETTLQEVNGRPTLIAGGERPLLLHLTSPHESDVAVASGLKLGDRQIAGAVRFFKNPALRAVQDFILQDFGAEYLGELARDEIATPAG